MKPPIMFRLFMAAVLAQSSWSYPVGDVTPDVALPGSDFSSHLMLGMAFAQTSHHNYTTFEEGWQSDYYSNITVTYNGTTNDDTADRTFDSWSIMWYLVSFGGLITFFLLVSLSEVCCKKSQSSPYMDSNEQNDEVSPPPYDLFAPPSYDSLFEEKKTVEEKRKPKKKKISIYVIHLGKKSRSTNSIPGENPLEFGEVISRNSMGDGEIVTPPPPP